MYQRDSSQPKGCQLRVIGYYSHTFTPAEINYNVTEKECLAVKLAVQYFQSYLEGKPFIVHTDHQALTSLMTLKQPKGRLCRWQTTLMPFEMIINHRRGNDLQDADAISRLCLNDHPPSLVNIVVSADDSALKSLVLKRYHDDADSGGHDGFLRTYIKIKSRFQWKNMKQEIENYVKTCHDCQINKFKYRAKHNIMTLPPLASTPYETVHLDYGEIKKKSEGIGKTQSFILLVDEATRMLHTKALNQKSKALIEWLNKQSFIGSVKKIVSDNGPSFASEEFRIWSQSRGIKHYFSAPYNPQANGLAERKMRDVKQFFSLYPKFKNGWKACLEAATFHHNRSYNTSIGCSPLFKLTGKQTLLPADKDFGITVDKLIKTEKSFTEKQIQEKREKMKDNFNAGKRSSPEIIPGDKILFQAGYEGKQVNIQGPVTVTDVIKKDNIPKTMIYRDETGRKKPVALKNSLPYHSRNMSNAVLTSLVLVALLSSCNAIFARDSPVLWVRSSIPVVDKVLNVNHTLLFKSPCQIFMNASFLTPSQYNDLNIWCSKRTNIVMSPLEKVCTLTNTLGLAVLFRRRRFDPLITPVLILSILSSAFVSYVFYEKSEKEFKEQERMVNILKHENQVAQIHLRTMTKDAINLTTRIELLEETIHQDRHSYANLTTAIVDTASEFDFKQTITRRIQRQWKEGQVPAELFEMSDEYNPNGLPDTAIVEQAVPISCELDKFSGTAMIHYQIPLKRNDSFIFEANSFSLLRNFTFLATNKTKTCVIKYTGPKYTLVTPKCIHILDSTSNTIGRTSYVFDNSMPCKNVSLADQERYWHRDDYSCVDVTEAKQFPAQIVTNLAGSFIYCFGHKVKIKGIEFDCPNYVFRLPIEQDFSIGKHTYSSDIKVVSMDSFSIIDHLRITSQVYPQIHSDPILKDLEELEKELEKQPSFDVKSYILQPSLLFTVLLFILLLVVVYTYFKKKSPEKRVRFQVNRSTRRPSIAGTIALEEIGGFIDDNRQQS